MVSDEIRFIRLGILFLTLTGMVGFAYQHWSIHNLGPLELSLAALAGIAPQAVIFLALGQTEEPRSTSQRSL